MSESRCEGLLEGTISAEMIDERMRIDTRCGPTAKLSNSTPTNAALKQTKVVFCRQRHLPFHYRASHSFATLAVSVLSFLHVSFDWPFVVGARRLSGFLRLQAVIDHMATLFFKYVDFMKYVTWFLEFTFWLILMYANAPGPSRERGEMAMAIARLPCALYAVHQMVFYLPCTVSQKRWSHWDTETRSTARTHTRAKALHARTFTHSLIHSFTHSLIHSFTHSLIHSFTHSLIHSFIHSFRVHKCHTRSDRHSSAH